MSERDFRRIGSAICQARSTDGDGDAAALDVERSKIEGNISERRVCVPGSSAWTV